MAFNKKVGIRGVAQPGPTPFIVSVVKFDKPFWVLEGWRFHRVDGLAYDDMGKAYAELGPGVIRRVINSEEKVPVIVEYECDKGEYFVNFLLFVNAIGVIVCLIVLLLMVCQLH